MSKVASQTTSSTTSAAQTRAQFFTQGTAVWVYLPEEQKKASTKELQGINFEEDISDEKFFSGLVSSVNQEAQTAVVVRDSDQKTMDLSFAVLYLRNPPQTEDTDDITTLTYLHEPGLLTNLQARYNRQMIYTYVGTILIAVNPFQRLSNGVYGKETIEAYRGQPLGKLEPHVYAIAEDSYRSMLDDNKNQSILVSGESGAGKTETTKYLLQYFAAMGKKGSNDLGSIEKQVLSSTPLLEAFGNAKTLRNDNSSRFGKFIEIQFNNGAIAGALLRTYLLEKSRIVRQTQGERNYHIFYQLVAGCTDEERKELGLDIGIDQFYYVNQSGCYEIENVSDAETFEETKHAMSTVGITKQEQQMIMRVIAAVLHVGNVTFTFHDKSNSCTIDNPDALKTACSLIQLDFEAIAKTMTSRNVTTGKESYTIQLTKEQAESARDALGMLLYSKMFDWIVRRINENICCAKFQSFIGVLDIYGFESFKTNSFEQFCINWANEKLQQQYNQHIFKLSQQEYIREKIAWNNIEFNDNQVCLDLIEKPPLSIMHLLDEECRFPKANEKTFAEKLYKNHTNNAHFEKPRLSNIQFTIKHYADKVTYDTTFFIDKNKDFIIPEQVAQLTKSPFALLASMMKKVEEKKSTTPTTTTTNSLANRFKSGAGQQQGGSSFQFSSVSSQFKDSLGQLMETIGGTYPHYIRCIKPNPFKQPNIFMKKMVLSQCRCSGVMESIRICLEGYPTKKLYGEFFDRYKLLSMDQINETDPRKACEVLLSKMGIEKDKYQFGTTKIFLRANQIEKVERVRMGKLNTSAVSIQKNVRAFLGYKKYQQIKDAAQFVQNMGRKQVARADYVLLKKHACATVIQSLAKGYKARFAYFNIVQSAIDLQQMVRQSYASSDLAKKKHELECVRLVQTRIRGYLARKVFSEALAEARSMEKIKKEKAGLELKVEELAWQMNAEQKQKSKLEENNKKLEQELESKTTELQNIAENWQQRCHELEQENQVLHKDVASLRTELATVQNERSMASNTATLLNQDLKKTIAAKEEQTSKLTTQNATLEQIIAELRAQLEREKKQREDAEKKILIMEQDKIKIKKRKEAEMAWDVEKACNNFVGDRQEKAERFIMYILFENETVDFCNNIPAPSFLLYHIIHHFASNLDYDRLEVLSINSVTAIIRSCTTDKMYYWLSAALTMLQLFMSDSHVERIQQVDKTSANVDLNKVRTFLSKYITEEVYVTFDNEPNDKFTDTNTLPKLLVFLRQVGKIFVRTYSQVISTLQSQLNPMVKGGALLEDPLPIAKPATVQSPPPAKTNTPNKAATAQVASPAKPAAPTPKQPTIQDVIEKLNSFYAALQRSRVTDHLMHRMLRQVMEFIDKSLMNEVLLRKEWCKTQKAQQLKSHLNKMEESLFNMMPVYQDLYANNSNTTTTPASPSNTNTTATTSHLHSAFPLLRQCINVLLLGDKNSLVQDKVKADIAPNLSYAQVHKLLNAFTKDEFEKAIIPSTLTYLVNKIQELKDDTIVVNPKVIHAITDVKELYNEIIEEDMTYTSFPLKMREELEQLLEKTMKQAKEEAEKQLQLQKSRSSRSLSRFIL